MPVPHFNIKITQRSKGNSAVAGAAYQAGEKLFSEYDQKTKNYTCKKEVVYTEIMLPPNAPPEYADRATLWNSVEEIEKQWNSQLARRFVAALPREVPMELLPQMVKEYCEEQFVSKGMCCDFAIHDPDPPGHNPHCHFMLTMRAIDENGKLQDTQPSMTVEEVRGSLDLTDNGAIKNSIRNCLTVFQNDPVLQGAVRYNILTERIDIVKPLWWSKQTATLTDTDLNYLMLYLEDKYSLTSEKKIQKALSIIADSNKYHPIRDYLNGLEWDGTERIRYALPRFLGAEEGEYTYQALRLFMLGAISRVFKPGCKFEVMLCLVGGQGAGKSTFFRLLAVKDEWFSDDLKKIDDDNVYRKMQGHWIIEMSEMIATANAKSIEDIKSFISRAKETYKVPYETHPADRLRQCVFGGSSNTMDFLPLDRSGNRRFLPIETARAYYLAEHQDEPVGKIQNVAVTTLEKFRSGVRKRRNLAPRSLPENDVRFIDPMYNELFRVPDGGVVQMTYPDGHQYSEKVEYLDDYHMRIGSSVQHICEFAERMARSHAIVEPEPLTQQDCRAWNLEYDYYLTVQADNGSWNYALYQGDCCLLERGKIDAPELMIEEVRDEIMYTHNLRNKDCIPLTQEEFVQKLADRNEIQSYRMKQFQQSGHDCYLVMQLQQDADPTLRFAAMRYLNKQNIAPSVENYEILYRGNLPEGKRSVPQAELLEQLYQKFNFARPTDYHGHSLSVSDVIMLNQDGKISAHYVDSIGFKELPGFLDKKPERLSVLQNLKEKCDAPECNPTVCRKVRDAHEL